MGLFGIHGSISGGLFKAIEEGSSLKCEALQIFTANQRMWTVKTPSAGDTTAFAGSWDKSRIKKIVSHNSYLVNLASVNPVLLEKSRASFAAEMERVAALDLDGLVFHPGSFTGGTYEQGVKNIIDSMNMALAKVKGFSSILLLETTAGSGNSIGGKFEQLAYIISGIKQKEKVGVCFDTAHVFEAGYNTKEDYEGVFGEFDKIVGVKNIRCFHINDSKTEFGSHADRHEHIGKGFLGADFFGKLVNDKRFRDVPMILETPKDGNMDSVNLKLLRKLSGNIR
jgi:deoxyribonuclease-4